MESFQSFYNFRYSFEENSDFGVFWNLFKSYAEITKVDQLLKINIDRQITSTIDRHRAIDVERARVSI